MWLVAILALAGIMAAGPSLSAAANAAVAAAAVTSTSARGSGTGAGPATGAQGSAAASTSGTNDDHLDAKPPRPAGARPNAVGRLDWRNRFDPRALDLRDLEMPTRIVPAVESAIVPGMLVAGGILAGQLLPFGYAVLPALAIAAFVLDRALSVERRWLADGPSSDDRLAILTLALVAAFVSFSGIAAFVHGGLVGFGLGVDGSSAGGGTGTSGADAIDETALIVLAGADGLIAGILGYRLARLGPIAPREAVLSAVTYAAIIAIGAGLLRAMAVPHLLGPALLTLLVYLWDAFHATTPSIRRDPRWIWQVGLLVGLSVLVVGWNLALRS